MFVYTTGSNGGSPSEPRVCDVVSQIAFEVSAFTSSLLRGFVLNSPRSVDDDKKERLFELVSAVEIHPDVPLDDKKTVRKFVDVNVEGKALADQLTHANIWDCLVQIYTGALAGVLG